jgi:hypothetical protein
MKNLDTHSAVKHFISSGMPEKQAEAVTTYVRNMVKSETNSDYKYLATKTDVIEVRNELKLEITEVKRDMKWVMALLMIICGLTLKIALFN